MVLFRFVWTQQALKPSPDITCPYWALSHFQHHDFPAIINSLLYFNIIVVCLHIPLRGLPQRLAQQFPFKDLFCVYLRIRSQPQFAFIKHVDLLFSQQNCVTKCNASTLSAPQLKYDYFGGHSLKRLRTTHLVHTYLFVTQCLQKVCLTSEHTVCETTSSAY